MGTPQPDHSSAIQEALLAGNKILAIKLYREQTGLGLKEAKDAVEKMEATLRTSSPDRFQKPSGRGCLAMVAVFVVVGVAIACLAARGI